MHEIWLVITQVTKYIFEGGVDLRADSDIVTEVEIGNVNGPGMMTGSNGEEFDLCGPFEFAIQ